MALTLDELLARLVNGTLTVEGAATELKIIIRDQPQQCSALIALVQRQVASGQLPHTTALTLLGAIEQIVTELSDPTAASDQRNVSEKEPTRTSRAQSISETLARLQTVRAHTELMTRVATPVANETMRSAPATPSKLADHTLNRSAPAEPTYSSSASSNAVNSPESNESSRTLRQNAGIAPTASRTVADSAPTEAAYARTLKSPADNTQVISERLVRSLEDVDEPQRGTLKPGSIVKKRFVLETLIGKGGMGLVFAAIDRRKEEAQDTNARVALKVLNADFERHPQSFIALQREARKAQTLAHPNVVTVFDFDRDGETVFMTMELLKGRPLEALVREARGKGIAPAIVLPVIRGIAEGLAYAHRKGIVHSDLKPGNVFIVEDGTPKILDFGIARAVPNANGPHEADIFDAGSLGAYTEAYATDEMIDGIDPHPADDLYALGIIGYELLTGLHPYQRYGAPTARKLGIKPPALKGLKLREAKAIERCLSFDRKQRPADAGEFLKLFRGVSTLQKVSLTAAAVLAITASYFGYENYVETSPAIAFAELPLQTQQEFTSAMSEGDKAWQFYKSESNAAALNDAIQFYSMAYATHPRNREAVRALRKSADAYLGLHSGDPTERREAAAFLQGNSEYFLKYAPAVEAAR